MIIINKGTGTYVASGEADAKAGEWKAKQARSTHEIQLEEKR